MTQVGEGVCSIPDGGKEKCCFCNKDHQAEKAVPKADFPRDMTKLKNEGRAYTIKHYLSYYPGRNMAPLVEWGTDLTKLGGYKAAAHHCIALKSVSQHEISGELKEAGYNPNRGSNCSWLPYSATQFSRARAYGKALQKHRGGHTDVYFKKVLMHINKVAKLVKARFCVNQEKADKEKLLYYMELQEKAIWQGLANNKLKAYHLYNTSYLDPDKPWGYFPDEVGKSQESMKASPSMAIDDNKAETESHDDPE